MKHISVFKKIRNFRKTPKKVRLSRSAAGNFGILVFLLLICSFMILPIAYTVIQSLKPIDEIFQYPPRFFVRNPTFENFRELLYLTENLKVPFLRYLFNSVFVTSAGTLAYVAVAAMAGFALAKGRFYGKALFSGLVVWAMLFRPEVTAVPSYFIVSGLGMVDTYGALIIPTLSSSMGVFLVRQFTIAAIPDSILEAAHIDGAGELRIFRSIVLPGIRPALLTVIIFTFQSLWNSAGTQQYIFSENLKQLPTVLSTIVAGGIARTGAATAVGVILMIPPVIVFLISQRSVMETMTHSGLK